MTKKEIVRKNEYIRNRDRERERKEKKEKKKREGERDTQWNRDGKERDGEDTGRVKKQR